jgi:glycerol-3-phosphate dehydrogenase
MPSFSTELLVIGAGATGLGIAWDACLRGIKVVVVDQSNIAQGTSGRYHGLLHSGGRYAVTDPISAEECASENLILRRIIPHAIEDTGGLYLVLRADTGDYADEWQRACHEIGIDVEPRSLDQVRRREPALTKEISQAFQVNAASLDSFDLLNSLSTSIRKAGGQILLHHRVNGFIIEDNTVVAAELTSELDRTAVQIGAEIFVNAAGPWADQVAALAGIKIPITHSKGTMIAMANRLTQTVIHRCRPPSSGDAIVPAGSVMIIGTTDLPVASANDLAIQPSEIDFLLDQGDELIPGFSSRRPLRAWSGIRPLYNPHHDDIDSTRRISRSHVLINHADTDGISGLASIFGGKLTSFRLMAQRTVDFVARELQIDDKCCTDTVPIEPEKKEFIVLSNRTTRPLSHANHARASVICECENVKRSDIEAHFQSSHHFEIDNLRRATRLGMGPCQSVFCSVRATGIAFASNEPEELLADLASFIDRRWRGTSPLAWGWSMRQMVLSRRLYLELLDIQQVWGDKS